MKCCRQLISFLLFIITTLALHAQLKNAIPFKRCPVRSITFEQGLLNNATTNIFTDQLGFTWVSTKTGLQRFNGYLLETISPVIGKDTFRINYPVFFYGLKNGNLWITCREGILEYDLKTNNFKHPIASNKKNNLSPSPIFPLKEKDGSMWCMEEGKGIVIYDIKGGMQSKLAGLDHAVTDAILNGTDIFFKDIICSNDHYILIRDRNDQIERIDLMTKTVRAFRFSGINIWSLAATQKNLYVVSDRELLMVNMDDGTIKKTVELKNILNDNLFTTAIWAENEKQLLISLHGHLYEADTACNIHYEFTDLGRNIIAPSGHINRLYTDKFGRIWVLANNDIKRIENTQIPFAHFIYPDEKNNFVRALYYDEDKGLVLAGCLGGGLQLYDTLSNPLWKKPIITADVKDVTGIEKLTKDDYLVITFRRGWFLLNLPSRQLRPLHLTADIEKLIRPRAINFGNNIQRLDVSTIALCTSDNVFLCSFSGNKLIAAKPVIPFTTSDPLVNSFLRASDKTCWAGTANGLLYRFATDGTLQAIHIPGDFDVRCITEDATHNIWVGTDKGLCIYSATGELRKRVTKETGLLNDCIYGLLPVENRAAVFASSNWGLSFITEDGRVNNYSKELGLQENEFNTASALKTLSGRYYFGGVNGITAFYPSALNIVSDSPIINVTRLMVNDSLFNSSAGSWKGDTILLAYNQNRIQLDLSALGLLNNNEYLYKYRLKEFESAWQTTRQPVGIKYILAPGEYTFEISCTPVLSTSDAVAVKRITIIISKPWWQTWWFITLAFLCGVSLISFLVQQYNRRKYVKKIRTLQLQQEIQNERERISRDLHDSLGVYAASITSNIEQVKIIREDKGSATALQELRSNAGSMVSQLGDTIWALKKDALSLTAISDRLKVFLQKLRLSYPSISININEQIDIDPVIPASQAFHLLQIVQEAVVNAIKHSHGDSIEVLIHSNENWSVNVTDNGKGMKPEQSNASHGNGLSNMTLRAKESGWQIKWKPNEQGGTTVEIAPATTF